MEISLEEIQKKFEGLPENLKWAIMAVDIDEIIIEIGKTQGLNVEQMGQLSLETHAVIFGFTPTDKFQESLEASLKFPREKIEAIVTSVNEKILKEIRAKMVDGDKNGEKKEGIPTENKKEDNQILGAAGIEIVPEKLELNTPKKENPSILAQKLSGFSKNEVVKTEHTLENITKNSEIPAKPSLPEETQKSGYTVDPYRMRPE
jgi:hypothetical protein